MRTRLFFGLAFLLASVLTSAQTLRDQIGRFDVAGYPGNSFPVVLTFPSGAPVSLSAVTKYIGTTTPLPAERQPSVVVAGNTATITFQFPRSAFEWQGYYEISWSGRTQLAGDINAKLSNRNSNAPVTTLLVASADKTTVSVSLIGGAGGSAGVTAADIAAVGDARYRKSSDPITWSMIPDRPTIPTFPTWLPTSNPGYQNESQVNSLISTALSGIQGTLSQQATDILNRVPISTYSTNRVTDQNATAAAQSTANNALSTAQSAAAGVIDVRTGYVPKVRTITLNGVTYGLDQDINATITAGQAGVTSLNGKNGNLSGFVESSDLTPYNTRLTAVENGKVNSVAGMGLSSNDFTSGLLAKLNGLDANLNTTKQDKITGATPLTAGNTSVGTLSVGSTTAGVVTLGGKRISKSDGLAFQFEDDVAVTGGLLTSQNVTAKEIHLTGANSAETAAFGIVPVTGVGVRMPGGWHYTTNGTQYNQGSAGFKTDGGMSFQGQGVSMSLTSAGFRVFGGAVIDGELTVTRVKWPDGTFQPSAGYTQAQQNSRDSTQNANITAAQNTANTTAANLTNYAPKTGVSNDFQVDGTFRIPTANDRWSGFDGLSSGQTTRFRLGDVTGAIDMVYGQPLTMRAYHGWVIQNQSGGANPALRVNGLSSGQNIFEFYNAANALRSSLSQAGQLFAAGGYRFPDGTVQTTAATVTSAPVAVTIAANQTALLNAIAAATTPTTISWVGSITLTSDIELQNKSDLFLNCYGKGGLYRDNSPNMIVIRGGLRNCGIRGINFSNQSGGSNGNTILFNEQGTVETLYIEYNTFTANGSENNGIASNSSGGAQDQFVTTHNGIYIRYNTFKGIPRMAIELKNHSADGPTPTWCERIFIEYNDISDCGTGSADGYGISLSGLFRYGRMAYNNIVNAKKYSLEGVLIADYVIEHNNVTDITTTSNGISLSNGYKAVAQIPVGANRNVKVRNNTFNVKGRSILSYWFNNCEFTRNTGSSQQRNEWIGDDNTITKNTFDVYNDWNAMQFATANRNRIVDNVATTYYHGGGVYTSSVIFLDASANNNYVRSNTLTRPVGSYNVHIEQNASVTNDIGTTAGSATNTLNTYVERRANTLGSDQVQVNTYQDMRNLGTVTVVTTVYVLTDDKNNAGKLSVYTLLPSGKRIWVAAVEDNN